MSAEKVKELEDKIINELPDESGWWKTAGMSECLSAGRKLLDKGFSVDEAYTLLENVFWAGINERGG
jgi:hypothetical protein